VTQESFSLDELRAATDLSAQPIQLVQAGDGEMLCYRHYASPAAKAAVIFYHGGGAHSGAGYQHLADGLRRYFDIDVYTPDIRGNGASLSPRGDSPTPSQVWEDVSAFVEHARAERPNLPLFLGGHSSGAGAVLNYAVWANRQTVEGYVFLSPQLGASSLTGRPSQRAPFVRVDTDAFVEYAKSDGQSHGHDYAVHFNYPADALIADPGLVSSITVNMSLALTPPAPQEQFAGLDRPFGLWIGSEDELFLPDRVLSFGSLAHSVRESSEVALIPGATHLSVLLSAHGQIGAWINDTVEATRA
jgi:alpha-beta hydrolase superfamily lysophospholipase